MKAGKSFSLSASAFRQIIMTDETMEETYMNTQAPSIFNDVIGPVMRGPSSSHVAGGARIGAMLRQACGNDPKKVILDFDVNGSLAESHDGHGTDMGFSCGILGIPLTDERMDQYETLLRDAGIDLSFRILDYGAEHPNHYRMYAVTGAGDEISMDAISTGGGMIEVISLNGFSVSMMGDFYEYCIVISDKTARSPEMLDKMFSAHIPMFEYATVSTKDHMVMIECRCSAKWTPEIHAYIEETLHPAKIYTFEPVLPTHSSRVCNVPFRTAEECEQYNQDKHLEFFELALLYESVRGNTSEETVWNQMKELLQIMRKAVHDGLQGTEYADRILHTQSPMIGHAMKSRTLVPGTVMNQIITYITAIMENKSSMGVIVAAPTVGSCGCLPGTVAGLADALSLDEDTAVKGLLAGGLIGVFFAEQATFAAEVGGCQVECGAGSGMAAAAVTQMMGGTAVECIDAASVALHGLTGLACDPVANRVEVPCLNKNIVGGMNALSSTNMILSGFDKVIPLDETIQAMYDIGQKLPLELRCTYGGLGKTKTSGEIRKKLEMVKND